MKKILINLIQLYFNNAFDFVLYLVKHNTTTICGINNNVIQIFLLAKEGLPILQNIYFSFILYVRFQISHKHTVLWNL